MTVSRGTRSEAIARLDERQTAMNDKLDEILEEVRKTNGRVTKLETWQTQLTSYWKVTNVLFVVAGTIIGVVLEKFLL